MMEDVAAVAAARHPHEAGSHKAIPGLWLKAKIKVKRKVKVYYKGYYKVYYKAASRLLSVKKMRKKKRSNKLLLNLHFKGFGAITRSDSNRVLKTEYF